MDKEEKADNYENVNMDMSDGSDNEMFACKDEYKAFKNQFSSKPKPKEEINEYGGDSDETSSRQGIQFLGQKEVEAGSEYGGSSEYGGGSEYGPVAAVAATASVGYKNPNTYPGYHQDRKGRPGFGRKSPSPKPTPAKIEREPKLYKDEEKKRSRSRERKNRKTRSRSRSGERKKRSRSRSRGNGRSRSKDKGKERRRSRSRDKGRDRKDDYRKDHDGKDRNSWRKDGGDGRRDEGDWKRGGGNDRIWRGGRDRRGGSDWHRRDENRKNVEDQMKKVEEMGVEMPKYYRPGAVNPVSYAEQVQKRKMLWKKSRTDDDEKVSQAVEPTAPAPAPVKTSFNKWEATNFGDEGTTEKFRRLMGIKAAPKPEEFQEVEDAPGTNAVKIMSDLEKNYEQARQQTHRNRGIGLGFSSSEGIFNSSTPSYPPGPMAGPPRPQMGPASVARPGYGINFVKKN